MTLALLTEDLREIRLAVNSYLELGGAYGIRPRMEVEMPKLIADAQELIGMLEAEYPQ